MSTVSLPELVDFRRLAARHTRLEGQFPLSRFARLREQLVDDHGVVQLEGEFFQDEDGRSVLQGRIVTALSLLCQRCLEPMALPVDQAFRLAAVWSEEQGTHLPAGYEAWIVQEDPVSLADMVEEELLLALPIVAAHDQDCQPLKSWGDAVQASVSAPERENPFRMLEALKKKSEDTGI